MKRKIQIENGHKCTTSYQITCNSISNEQKELIINNIKKNTGLRFNNQKECIYLQTEDRNKFTDILNKYSKDCLKYKIRKINEIRLSKR